MGYIYGPVPSRRLGSSLGIDPIPMKTCNWNCVYCQLGRTARLMRERSPHVPATDILEELEEKLGGHRPGEIDWVTIVGSGEPTLNSEIGILIEGVKKLTTIPVGVITNGSLLSDRQVRRELRQADAVLPTLDAGNEELFRRINRPLRALTLERHLEGLRTFRTEYTGFLWVEVMLVSGMNDGEEELLEIAKELAKIRPDRVDLSEPERPPLEPWVSPSSHEGKLRALAILGEVARVLPPTPQRYDFSSESMEESIADVIARHPLPDEELRRQLPASRREEIIAALEKGGRVQRVRRYGRWFWTSSDSSYGDYSDVS